LCHAIDGLCSSVSRWQGEAVARSEQRVALPCVERWVRDQDVAVVEEKDTAMPLSMEISEPTAERGLGTDVLGGFASERGLAVDSRRGARSAVPPRARWHRPSARPPPVDASVRPAAVFSRKLVTLGPSHCTVRARSSPRNSRTLRESALTPSALRIPILLRPSQNPSRHPEFRVEVTAFGLVDRHWERERCSASAYMPLTNSHFSPDHSSTNSL
jgi:hypothetical protein